MSKLSKKPIDVPALVTGPSIPEGKVFVLDGPEGKRKPQLADGEQAVLLADGGRRELTTLDSADGIDNARGTYLNKADFEAFDGKRGNPRLRRYGWSDGWRKAKSRKGWVLIVTTLLGLLLAGYGAVLEFGGESPTSAATVAERSQKLVRWVAAPAAGATTDVQVAQREARAQRCLTRLRGGEEEIEKLAGVDCETSTPSFLLNKDNKAWLAALVGLITAALGGIGVRDKFRFGQQPT